MHIICNSSFLKFYNKYYIFLILLTILFPKSSYSKISIVQELSLFQLSMSFEKFKNLILKNFQIKKNSKSIFGYNFTNYNFFLEKNVPQNFYYSNENIKFILKQSLKYTNFSKLQVQLKKVFSYVLCNDCQFDRTFIFSNNKELLNNTTTDTDDNSSVSISNFFNRMIYHIISLPTKKLNKTLRKAHISFFEDHIFQIIYQLHLSPDEIKFLYNHLKEKYILKKDELNKKLVKFEAKDQSQSIFLLKDSKSKSNSEYFLYYYHNEKNSSYLNYLKEVKENLDNLIEFNQFHFLYHF